MITKMSGTIDAFTETSVIVENRGIYYKISIPPVQLTEIKDTYKPGGTITLHTQYYIEGGVGIGNLVPRLLGFLQESDREFFEIFTTVKGLGERKALQAMTIPIPSIGSAVESGDILTLKKLPGIGGRMADKIVAELKGKLTKFAASGFKEKVIGVTGAAREIEDEAYEILISQLGYRRVEAENLIQRAIAMDKSIDSLEALLQSIYAHKTPVHETSTETQKKTINGE